MRQHGPTGRQGRIHDIIRIEAEDDLGRADLNVSLVAQDGTSIESGKAVVQPI